ncbi:hypothetical protein [Mesomycoplasma dispar]|uniref:hypothetical protein n=1 Tax=Mesomycoplasma dispar TaxID=86660 RepID=UPI001E5B279B|nr:hypothetical protein [Mesomycoplasma dispar]
MNTSKIKTKKNINQRKNKNLVNPSSLPKLEKKTNSNADLLDDSNKEKNSLDKKGWISSDKSNILGSVITKSEPIKVSNQKEKYLDFSYKTALKNPIFSKWIKKYAITEKEFRENIDLFWLSLQYSTKPNYKYEIIRNFFTNKLASKIVFLYDENENKKEKWTDFFLLPEISLANVEDFVHFFLEDKPKSKIVLPLDLYKDSFKKLTKENKLIYFEGGDSFLRYAILKSFAIIFAKNSKKVGFFNLSDICRFVYENKVNLTDKLKNIEILIIEFDLINNYTTPFFPELGNVLADRIISEKLTFLGFDANFNLQQNNEKILKIIEHYGYQDQIWINLENDKQV